MKCVECIIKKTISFLSQSILPNLIEYFLWIVSSLHGPSSSRLPFDTANLVIFSKRIQGRITGISWVKHNHKDLSILFYSMESIL